MDRLISKSLFSTRLHGTKLAQKLAIVPKNPYICVYQAIDSIDTFVASSGLHYVDIVAVTGSIPVTPTISSPRKMHEYSGIWRIRSGDDTCRQACQWTGFHIRHRVAKQFCIYPVWQAVKGIPGTLMLTWGCYI